MPRFYWLIHDPSLSTRYTLLLGNPPPPSPVHSFIASHGGVLTYNATLCGLQVPRFRLVDANLLVSDPLFPRPFLAVPLPPFDPIEPPGEHGHASPPHMVVSCHAFDRSTRDPPLSTRYTLPPRNSPPTSLIRLSIPSHSVVSSCNTTLHDL